MHLHIWSKGDTCYKAHQFWYPLAGNFWPKPELGAKFLQQPQVRHVSCFKVVHHHVSAVPGTIQVQLHLQWELKESCLFDGRQVRLQHLAPWKLLNLLGFFSTWHRSINKMRSFQGTMHWDSHLLQLCSLLVFALGSLPQKSVMQCLQSSQTKPQISFAGLSNVNWCVYYEDHPGWWTVAPVAPNGSFYLEHPQTQPPNERIKI